MIFDFILILLLVWKLDNAVIKEYKTTYNVHSISLDNSSKCEELFEIPYWTSQAGCYTENGQYVICYPSSFGDLLIIRCYNRSTDCFIWQKSIEGCGHANAICFRPNDRKPYIADCFREGNFVNTISVLDFDQIEKGVVEVIESPARGGIYSIAYDRDADIFYSSNYLGSKEGETNVLFSYNGVFKSVREEVFLDDLSVRSDPHYSSQGVQFVKDGIAYIPYYVPEERVVGFDVESGRQVVNKKIPDSIDGHKIIEIESISYDYEKSSFMIVDAFGLIESQSEFADFKFISDIPFRWAMCGCYIENNIYIIAYPSSDGNSLILRGIDSEGGVL